MNTEIQVVTGGGRTTSLQVVQDIYNNLTNKTETLSRLFFDAHIAHLSDLENLHAFVEQSIEQYDCKVSNCAVSVRFCDGKSENFSSFTKFRSLGVNRSRPTVEVEFEYDFLILLPKTTEAKPYKLVVGLRSGIGIVEGFRHTNATEAEKSMYYQFQTGTARLEIHYVDLAVARSLEAAVEDWYRGLKKVSGGLLLGKVREFSRLLPSLLRTLVIGSSIAVSYYLLSESTRYVSDLFRSIAMMAGTVGIALSFSIPISGYVGRLLDRSRPSCAVVISQADSRLYDESKNSSAKTMIKAVGSALGAVGIGLVTAYIGSKIGLP